MRLTKQTLKRIIKEELGRVLNEGIGDNFYGMYGNKTQSAKPAPAGPTGPQMPEMPPGIPPEHTAKIKKMLQSDDDYEVNQGLMFVDTFAPESSFREDYLEYLGSTPPREMDSYDQAVGPDDRVALRKKIYDQVNQQAANIYPDDPDAAYEWAYKKIQKAGLLEEGILNQMEAEKILRDEFFRTKELRSQGKATDEEVRKAYNDMTNLDTSQFYTDEELASFEAEKAQRDIDDQASIDREIEAERSAERRLDQDRMDYLRTAKAAQGGRFQTPGPDGEINVRGIGATLGDEGPEPEIEAPDFRTTRAGPRGGGRMSESLHAELMYEGDASILEMFENATLEEGGNACGACLFEQLQEASCGCPDLMGEAEYQGKKVTLNKPTRGDVKKFKVYVKDPSTGNIKKVNFGHGGSSAKAKGEKTMKIRKNNPKARKSFRARHNCDNPGPKTKARYWSCKKW